MAAARQTHSRPGQRVRLLWRGCPAAAAASAPARRARLAGAAGSSRAEAWAPAPARGRWLLAVGSLGAAPGVALWAHTLAAAVAAARGLLQLPRAAAVGRLAPAGLARPAAPDAEAACPCWPAAAEDRSCRAAAAAAPRTSAVQPGPCGLPTALLRLPAGAAPLPPQLAASLLCCGWLRLAAARPVGRAAAAAGSGRPPAGRRAARGTRHTAQAGRPAETPAECCVGRLAAAPLPRAAPAAALRRRPGARCCQTARRSAPAALPLRAPAV